MNRLEHLLDILGEECSEVHQRGSKAMRFSLTEIQPDSAANPEGLTNAQRIIREYWDVCAMMEMVHRERPAEFAELLDFPKASIHIELKKAKVERFLALSKEMGTLNEDGPGRIPVGYVWKVIDMETLDEARTELREAVKKGGVTCPCCQQHVQVYQRSVTSSMAAGLVNVWVAVGAASFRPLEVQSRRGLPYRMFSDFQKLRYWELIAEQSDGSYRITSLGEAFLQGNTSIDKYAVVYNGNVIRMRGPRTDIREILRRGKFDLDQLLRRSKASDGDAGKALEPSGRLALAQ